MIYAQTLRQLSQVDWDFPAHLPGTTKNFHWYPGTFPSDLPTTLIQALSRPSELVIDPYGGVGTTALEGLRQGRKAWITEANPIGCLVAYVAGGMILLKAINPDYPAIIIHLLKSIVLHCAENRKQDGELFDTTTELNSDIDLALSKLIQPTPDQFLLKFSSPPNTSALSLWIERETLKKIELILDNIRNRSIGNFGKLFGLLMVSSAMRPASSQTKSWGHIADNVRPKSYEQKDVISLYLRWLSRIETIIKNTDVAPIFSNDMKVRYWVSLHNWLHEELPKEKPTTKGTLLVTSPPYAGAIDYTLAQRLSLYALGTSDEDVCDLCKMEIGARRKRFDSVSLQNWAEQMSYALNRQLSYLSQNANAAFVLPHKDAGRELGTEALKKCMFNNNWKMEMEIDRSIRQVRARQSWTSIKRETIYIFSNTMK